MLKKALILLLIFTSSSFALTKEQIRPEMATKINKVLVILKNSNIEKEKKVSKIISIMNPVFDYKIMSMLSLGRTWKKISENERKEFIELFTEELKKSYLDKLDLYTNEPIKIIGLEQTKKSKILFKTQLIGKEQNFDINYKFYKNTRTDDWLIYDVDLLGVSIVRSYHAQYKGFLKEKSFDELLKFLKKNNQ